MAVLTLTGEAGQRLDLFLHRELSRYSRSRLQDWIKSGHVLVDGTQKKASFELRGGERIEVTPDHLPPLKAEPEDVPLSVLYEDAAVIAIDKPAGMVVHAGAGVHSGTLVNAVLGRFARLSSIGGEERPGIVHRLDKETSGVILVARTDEAHQSLARQFATRTVEKEYLALVEGAIPGESGRIDKPIGRDPIRRTRMTTRVANGRAALTDWHLVRRYLDYSYLRVRIGTGRTHQIRVHLSSLKHPVAGDVLYGARRWDKERFFLHAHRIAFDSPATGQRVEVTAPLASELAAFLDRLE